MVEVESLLKLLIFSYANQPSGVLALFHQLVPFLDRKFGVVCGNARPRSKLPHLPGCSAFRSGWTSRALPHKRSANSF